MWQFRQEVCPFNRGRGQVVKTGEPTAEPAFQPRDITVNSTLEDILLMTQEEFRVAFKGSAVKRAKWKGPRRNAKVAAVVAGKGLTPYVS